MRTNSVGTVEELLVEFVPQTFKRYFQDFLLKANQQFVKNTTDNLLSSNPMVYIVAGKGVRSIIQEELRPTEMLVCK